MESCRCVSNTILLSGRITTRPVGRAPTKHLDGEGEHTDGMLLGVERNYDAPVDGYGIAVSCFEVTRAIMTKTGVCSEACSVLGQGNSLTLQILSPYMH